MPWELCLCERLRSKWSKKRRALCLIDPLWHQASSSLCLRGLCHDPQGQTGETASTADPNILADTMFATC